MEFAMTTSKHTTQSAPTLSQSIVLVGLMGCGKSSIGKRLAKRLDVKFIDTDNAIEAAAGCTITQIFKSKGEAYFRKIELKTISALLDEAPCIIATGGGAYIQDAIRSRIKEKALAVWLSTEFDVLLDRVSRKKTRPLLEQGDKAEILRKLMNERTPIYEQADITVESSSGPHNIVVKQIMDAIEAFEEKR